MMGGFCFQGEVMHIEKAMGLKWAAIEEGAEIHVIPLDDLREHVSEACWCHPTPEDDRPNVIVHHSMDRREFSERQ